VATAASPLVFSDIPVFFTPTRAYVRAFPPPLFADFPQWSDGDLAGLFFVFPPSSPVDPSFPRFSLRIFLVSPFRRRPPLTPFFFMVCYLADHSPVNRGLVRPFPILPTMFISPAFYFFLGCVRNRGPPSPRSSSDGCLATSQLPALLDLLTLFLKRSVPDRRAFVAPFNLCVVLFYGRFLPLSISRLSRKASFQRHGPPTESLRIDQVLHWFFFPDLLSCQSCEHGSDHCLGYLFLLGTRLWNAGRSQLTGIYGLSSCCVPSLFPRSS